MKKIAIVADWIIGGGAERVVEQLHAMYPDAPIYASYCSDEWRAKLDNKVVTGYLQKWPFNKLRKFVGPLRIWWYKYLDLSEYDVVISCTGNGEAKFIRTIEETKHICYCFTPTHYYWRHYQTYINNPGFGFFNPLARLGLKVLVYPLRKLDYAAAQNPNAFIAISNHIKDDIKKFYNRDSEIIHPPVDTKRFKDLQNIKRSGFITVGRQTPYKNTDLIIQACNELNVPLTVVGTGPEHEKLTNIANDNIKFMPSVNDVALPELLDEAKGFIFASEEDFGIAPVEAMATGLPVIAFRAGGALDYVNEQTGIFFDEQTTESLKLAIKSFNNKKFNSNEIMKSADKFSVDNFKNKINKLLQ